MMDRKYDEVFLKRFPWMVGVQAHDKTSQDFAGINIVRINKTISLGIKFPSQTLHVK